MPQTVHAEKGETFMFTVTDTAASMVAKHLKEKEVDGNIRVFVRYGG